MLRIRLAIEILLFERNRDMRINSENTYRDLDIAVIGMDCRFPDASNCSEYWENLCTGKKSRTDLSDEDLRNAGVADSVINNPHYVKAVYKLDNVDKFDASFFGFTPQEAKLMDPQQRILLEVSWNALEDAGYANDSYEGHIGLFVGKSSSQYLMKNLFSNYGSKKIEEMRPIWNGNDITYTATMISYKLNLTGPSICLQSACSTSLLAVSMACQSLINYECDMALAGGCRIAVPQNTGYMYLPGEVLSSDGNCRPFDAKANGTVTGSGAGIVVLKRLSEAVQDGDQIIAVIKGSAVNNDGSLKVGYAAPSVSGERRAIRSAQLLSEVDPETITYIETHGTATELGDPIEIQALTEAFELSTDKKHFCTLGAVKANIGHLDIAAGIAGFIKTCLVLKHGVIPPNCNFQEPNKNIDFVNTPFYINKDLMKWSPNCGVRRAGVSSFGIGGTNVHVVLEEAIDERKSGNMEKPQLMLLSGRTHKAVETTAVNLLKNLKNNADVDYKNAVYSMSTGRKSFLFRSYLVCDSREECINKLDKVSESVHCCNDDLSGIVFMFPGQGSQYIGMVRELYEKVEYFKNEIDHCSNFLMKIIGYNLCEVLFKSEPNEENQKFLLETQNTHVALFSVEYALAKLLMELGIKPSAMIGHSLGEYVAACISGTLDLESALTLVAERGRIIQGLPKGAMLSVNLCAKEAEKYCNERISLAVENTSKLSVLSGDIDAINELAEKINGEIQCRILHTSHAFHSHMMNAGAEQFRIALRKVKFKEPSIPYISNVTGDWIKKEDVMDTEYWVSHLVKTVRIREGAEKFIYSKERCFFEVGPGNTLTIFMRNNLYGVNNALFFDTINNAKNAGNDMAYLLNTLGKAWLHGMSFNVDRLFKEDNLKRISIPTYPFERESYWVGEVVTNQTEDTKVQQEHEANDGDKLLNNRINSLSQYVAPDNELEKTLANILEGIMGIHPIGVTDDFFELGGHSLIASQVIARIWENFGLELNMTQFMDRPTVRQVADLIYEELTKEEE